MTCLYIKHELSGKSCSLIRGAIGKEWVSCGLLVWFFPMFIVYVDGKSENIPWELAWELLLVAFFEGMTYFTILLES